MEKKNCEFSFSRVYDYSGSLYYLDVLLKDEGFKRDGSEWSDYYEDEWEEESYSIDENIIISKVGNYAQIFVEIKASGAFWGGKSFGARVCRLEEIIDSAENETIWRTANHCAPAMSDDEMWELFEFVEDEDIMKESMEDLIKKMKRIDGIPTPDALRDLTTKSIEEGKEKLLHDLFLIHKDHIGKYMIKEAKRGCYECWSDKLENVTEWDCEIPAAEISEYLQKKIYTVFGDALGFDVTYIPADNVMVISWGK